MQIANLDYISSLGKDYGWDDRTIEEALANSIRLCYAERDMLVEVDVNMAMGTIACRRRNGEGERGLWVDIRDPLMPSSKMFMQVMQMQQWGDGSPGRVMEGIVTGFRDGGVIYRVSHNMVFVPEALLSVHDFQHRPQIGQEQVLSLISSKENASGLRMGSRRGLEFVSAVMECYYPECVSGIWMGASNGWAVIRMDPDVMDEWLEHEGMNLKHLQDVLGIRRITLIPACEEGNEQEKKDAEIKHFINNSWRACKIKELTPSRIVLYTPIESNDPRKLRTFASMLEKIAPEREQIIV